MLINLTRNIYNWGFIKTIGYQNKKKNYKIFKITDNKRNKLIIKLLCHFKFILFSKLIYKEMNLILIQKRRKTFKTASD